MRQPEAGWRRLTDHAIQWLKKHSGQEFFLWLHYFDPHMPYNTPVPFQPTDPEMLAREPGFRDKSGAYGKYRQDRGRAGMDTHLV